MRVRISKKNIQYYLKQQYAFSSDKQFFKLTEHNQKFRNKVIYDVVKEFTGFEMKQGRLMIYNPYTDKNEALKIKGFDHITNTEELLTDLSMLYKAQQKMLEQSRDRILELAEDKKYSRDQDLEIRINDTESLKKDRLDQIPLKNKSVELDR